MDLPARRTSSPSRQLTRRTGSPSYKLGRVILFLPVALEARESCKDLLDGPDSMFIGEAVAPPARLRVDQAVIIQPQ